MSEILAPAGGINSAYAAINSGADAIYLGLDRFSARSSAENFGDENFRRICGYAHAFGVKIYVALNTVVKDSELNDFFRSAVYAHNCGADALIIQDIFLGEYLKMRCPDIKLHLSTQAGTCNMYGARLAKEKGFERVVLARETSLSDISEISKIIETEAFVQGALCTCFSGQCFMSSFAGGNSGNRGKCKQPCRKLYSIDRNGFEDRAYRLSLSDLSVGEDIERYISACVTSFKIEGRMRRPEYVASAVKYYRDLLDGKQTCLSDLKRTYNRGNYTKGLAFGQDKSFISSAVQGHIGEFVGIIKVENSKYICQGAHKFNSGDGFKILRGGREIGGGIFGGAVKGGFIINTRDRLKNGDKVFVTTDTALNTRLLSQKRLIPVTLRIEMFAEKPVSAEINGKLFMGEICERANTRPLAEEDIEKCFKKVDGFPFDVKCDVQTDGVFMAASQLNSFRRKVYAEYFSEISDNKNKHVAFEFCLPARVEEKNNKTAVISTDLTGVKADIGILKLQNFNSDIENLIKDFKGEKFLFLPPYLNGEEIRQFIQISGIFDGIYCDNYFGAEIAKKLDKKFFAGYGFNITNRISLDGCQADYICLSKELTLAEANALSAKNVFYLSAGNIKVMDLIYCPFERKCASCDKRTEYIMTDGDGRKFPLHRYETGACRFELYNCSDLESVSAMAGGLSDRTLKTQNYSRTRGHTVNGIL